MAKFGDFLKEARRRRVFRGAALYIVGAWVVLQAADLAFESWGVPIHLLRYVWIGAVFGFPLAMIFAWLYEITPQGIVRTLSSQEGEDIDLSLDSADYVILAALLLVAIALAYGLVEQIRIDPRPDTFSIAPREINPNSIAVLPLDNLSGNPEQAYFVEGMHDALITSLSRIGELRVTSRTSAMQADTNLPIPEIGRELGVATIIEGSVFRVDDRVRITLQLIDTATDQHLWAHDFERKIENVFALQNDVSRAVARQVQVALTPNDEERLNNAHRVDPAVFELYQQGLYQRRAANNFEGLGRATELLERAVAADPGFARAWAALSDAHTTYSWWGDASQAHMDRAKEAAIEALRIDPYLAEAHLALRGAEPGQDNDWEADRRRVLRALELNPSLAAAHQANAWQLMEAGQVYEAIAAIEKALELDPLNVQLSIEAFAPWYFAREWERALEQLNRSRLLSPDLDPYRQIFYGRVYAQMGRYDAALASYENALGKFDAENVFDVWTYIFIAQTHAMAGHDSDSRLWLAKILARSDGESPPIGLAMVYAILGEIEIAIDLLEQGYEMREPQLGWLRTEPSFDNLRSQPRFQSLLARKGIPQPSLTRSPNDD